MWPLRLATPVPGYDFGDAKPSEGPLNQCTAPGCCCVVVPSFFPFSLLQTLRQDVPGAVPIAWFVYEEPLDGSVSLQ